MAEDMAEEIRAESEMRAARRRFLASCGKLAVATPPAVTLLLVASRQNYATAISGWAGNPPDDACVTDPGLCG
ncbi:MAG TPA: hypothetical protein VE631_09625 [Alphaproteobacteria bacterium]|nr:hypothetical protein [Alphaproteobacteria bacterium]